MKVLFHNRGCSRWNIGDIDGDLRLAYTVGDVAVLYRGTDLIAVSRRDYNLLRYLADGHAVEIETVPVPAPEPPDGLPPNLS